MSYIKGFLRKSSGAIKPSIKELAPSDRSDFTKVPEGSLFPKVDPAVDGEDCDHDCVSCSIHYPAKFTIDEEDKLYGFVKGWSTHLIVATGKTDWVRDVEDEKGSVMEAVGKCGIKPANGRLMLSASNMPAAHTEHAPGEHPTTVLLLPAFTFIDNVTPKRVPDLIRHCISTAPTNTSPLTAYDGDDTMNTSTLDTTTSIPTPLAFSLRACQHDALILMCSQKTRDARCGQSAPLLRCEFERLLRPLGLYRDLQDERPGGVGIYFISHTGGHKYSANVMVYRRAGIGKRMIAEGGGGLMVVEEPQEAKGEAAQCIWLARVRPEDCEGILRYTVLQGKVVKPERQLRGGFDREKGICSW